MEINVSKNEYKDLLEMLFLADWVMNAHTKREDTNNISHHSLKQKILSLAKDFGCEHLVEYNEELDMLVESEDFETSLFEKFINQYDQNTFWLNLASQLAIRDYEEKYGSTNMDLKLEKTKQELDESEEKYLDEFSENGVKYLKIVED